MSVYSNTEILTAFQQSHGASISADTSKVDALKKEIDMAYAEIATIFGSDNSTKPTFNILWFLLSMYRCEIVASGVTEAAIHLYKRYQDYLDKVSDDSQWDATNEATAPGW